MLKFWWLSSSSQVQVLLPIPHWVKDESKTCGTRLGPNQVRITWHKTKTKSSLPTSCRPIPSWIHVMSLKIQSNSSSCHVAQDQVHTESMLCGTRPSPNRVQVMSPKTKSKSLSHGTRPSQVHVTSPKTKSKSSPVNSTWLSMWLVSTPLTRCGWGIDSNMIADKRFLHVC